MEVDICENNQLDFIKLSLKTHDNLKLNVNEHHRVLTLWNKFNLFIFNDYNFHNKPLCLSADFLIDNIVISNNCIVCVDSNGYAHTYSLKCKMVLDKIISISFKARLEGILCAYQINNDNAVILHKKNEQYLICINKINQEFKMVKKYNLNVNNLEHPHTKYFLKSFPYELDGVSTSDLNLTFYSFDCKKIYMHTISTKSKEDIIEPVEIYTCPSAFTDILIKNYKPQEVVIALKSGTLLVLTRKNEKEFNVKSTIHLNSAIYKIISFGDTIVYSNCITLWKLDKFTNSSAYEKLTINQPLDIVKVSDKLMCITYTKYLYFFDIDYVKMYSMGECNSDYIPVTNKMPNTKDLIRKIMDQVDKNEKVLESITREKLLTTAVALSTKENLLDSSIAVNIKTYQRYSDVIDECKSFHTVTKLEKYFKDKLILIMLEIKIDSQLKNKLNEITSVLENCLIISLFVKKGSNFRTFSIPVRNEIQNVMKILIPVKVAKRLPSEITFDIIYPIKGALDVNDRYWSIVYSKSLKITAEHLIKINTDNEYPILNLVEQNQNEILKFACKNNLNFNVEEIQPKHKKCNITIFVKLITDFEKKFSVANLKKYLSEPLSKYLSNKLANPDFIKGERSVLLTVHTETNVILNIILNEEMKLLSIQSCDTVVNMELKYFFIELLYDTRQVCDPPLIPQFEYTRLENLCRETRSALSSATSNEDDFCNIFERLNKSTYSLLYL